MQIFETGEKKNSALWASIDGWMGYRFYNTSQLKTTARIKFYRQLGLSNAEIKSIYHKIAYEYHWRGNAYIMEYAEKNGYTIAGLARESYTDGIRNKESVEDWLTEVQLPIR